MRLRGNLETNAVNEIASTYPVDTGTANNYVVSLRPGIPTGLTIGLKAKFIVANANTGPVVINVSGNGNVPVKKDVSADLNANDWLAGEIVEVSYDGTNFQWLGASFVPTQNGVVFGGQVTWLGGFDFRVSAAGYYINFQYFTSPITLLTLSAPDGTFDRFDTFVLTNLGTVTVVQGTPTATPTEPPLDIGTQLRIGTSLVQTGTTDAGIATECIYLENTEWTTGGTNGGRINANALTLPRSGIKDVQGTSVSPADFITFTRSSSFTPMASFSMLNLWVRAKSGWGATTRLVFQWYNGAVAVGNSLSLQPGTFGFITSDTTNYQSITLPLSSFGINPTTTVTALRITATAPSTFAGFYLDDMCLMAGDVPPSFTLPTFQNAIVYNPVTNTVEFGTNPLLHATTLETNSFIQTFSGATVYDYPYQFVQRQAFQNGTSIASFKNSGSNIVTEPDNLNLVKLGVNYTGKTYATSPFRPGYAGPNNIGYLVGVNFKGHGSFGVDTENSASKIAAMMLHTLDTGHTEAISFFAKQNPNVNESFLTLEPYTVAALHTTGAFRLHKYGIGTFTGTTTSIAGFDANGNMIEIDPDDLGGGDAITADNGLKMSTATNVRLGGPIGNPGLLMQPTYINTDIYTLYFSNSAFSNGPMLSLETLANSTNAVYIRNGGNLTGGQVPTAIRAVADGDLGIGVAGNGSWYGGNFFSPLNGVRASTTSGTGLYADASVESGVPIFSGPTSATGTTAPIGLQFQTSMPGTVGNGIGNTIDFHSYYNGTSFLTSGSVGSIIHKLTDAQQGTLHSQLSIQGVHNSTTKQTIFTLEGSGSLQLNKYGIGTFADTAAYILGVDSTGNVIETTLGALGSTRFGVLGEDDIANETRAFDLNSNTLSIAGIGTIGMGTFFPNSGFTTDIEATGTKFGALLTTKRNNVTTDADAGVGHDGQFIVTGGTSYNGSAVLVGLYGELGFQANADWTYVGSRLDTTLSGLNGVVTMYENTGSLVSGNSIFSGGEYHLHVAGIGNVDRFASLRALYPRQTPGQSGWSGTLGTHYGLFIDDISNSGFSDQITNKYGIYQEGLTEDNYLGGTLHIKSLDTDGTAPVQTGTIKMVTTDANGLLSFDDVPGGGGGSGRFGVSGEDDTAAENRLFDLGSTFAFNIHNGPDPVLYVDPSLGLYRLGNVNQGEFAFQADISSAYARMGNATNYLTVSAAGVNIYPYGSGMYLGTPTFSLAVDSSGNVIEGFPTLDQIFDADGNSMVLDNTNTIDISTHDLYIQGTGGNFNVSFANGFSSTSISANSSFAQLSSYNSSIEIGSTFNLGDGTTNLNVGDLAVGSTDELSVINLSRTSLGGSAAGIGQKLVFIIDDDSGPGSGALAAELGIQLTDVTAGAVNSKITWRGVQASVLQDWLILTPGGLLTIAGGAPNYADNTAAVAAGLAVGTFYRTGDTAKIVH
jgi:hypothetical protein